MGRVRAVNKGGMSDASPATAEIETISKNIPEAPDQTETEKINQEESFSKESTPEEQPRAAFSVAAMRQSAKHKQLQENLRKVEDAQKREEERKRMEEERKRLEEKRKKEAEILKQKEKESVVDEREKLRKQLEEQRKKEKEKLRLDKEKR